MFFFGLAFFLLLAVAELSVYKDSAHLDTLLKSEYEYSFLMNDSVYPNSYYQLNANITFSTIKKDKSLNATVIMQSQESEYTEIVYWNPEPLGLYEVAMTRSLANQYGVREGDKLLSKHIVTGEQIEYCVKYILPELTDVRIADRDNFHDGVIIMGYDGKYIENISHLCIVFSDGKSEALNEGLDNLSEKLVYRSDEVIVKIKKIMPYAIIYVFLAILLITSQFGFLWKITKYNLRRYVMLGYERKSVNKAINRTIFQVSALMLLMVLITFLITLASDMMGTTCGIVVFGILGGSIISIIICAQVIKHMAWRA